MTYNPDGSARTMPGVLQERADDNVSPAAGAQGRPVMTKVQSPGQANEHMRRAMAQGPPIAPPSRPISYLADAGRAAMGYLFPAGKSGPPAKTAAEAARAAIDQRMAALPPAAEQYLPLPSSYTMTAPVYPAYSPPVGCPYCGGNGYHTNECTSPAQVALHIARQAKAAADKKTAAEQAEFQEDEEMGEAYNAGAC